MGSLDRLRHLFGDGLEKNFTSDRFTREMSDQPGSGKEPRPFGQRDDESANAGAAYMGLGLQFGLAIILFMFVG